LPEYSFDSLNDKEFEQLVNDLVSRREGISVDRYKSGKDGGIDGRFFSDGSREVIIQSKHWLKSGIAKLLLRLKNDEVPKVRKLSPSRYILATSLPLSKHNKDKIQQLFDPYIVSHDDIIGQENLNDLLSKHTDVEIAHYKLWLSSSNVMSSMFNSALIGRSEAKRLDIIESTPRYVATENHKRALACLEGLHTVVITGEAGIGKTSLADQLAHHYMASGYELCVIEDDISEAEGVYQIDKAQVFYFDDFLGRNFLMAMEGKKDSQILGLIDRVSKDDSKRFILTSRSTILNQGKDRSDLFDLKKIDKKEYEVTIQSLTVFDRAEILYNHIWHSDLSGSHIDIIYEENRFLEVAKHKNFNPRLISFITDPDRVNSVETDQYWRYIEDSLDNPKGVWAEVFDNQIDDLARLAVCIVTFNGSGLAEASLRNSTLRIAQADGLVTAATRTSAFLKMLKASVGSILQRTVEGDDNVVSIDLFNPSVADFLLERYLDDDGALALFFANLDTLASLRNLRSLHTFERLSGSTYSEILKRLSVEKINTENYLAMPEYVLTLADMVLNNSRARKLCDVTQILDCLMPLLGDTALQVKISPVATVFTAALEQSPDRFRNQIIEYIEESSPEASTLNELLKLEKLRRIAFRENANEDTGLLEKIQAEVISYWEEDPRFELSQGGVLDEFYPDEEHAATDAALEYVSSSLADFGIPWEVANEIVESLDIADILYDNFVADAKSLGSEHGPDEAIEANDLDAAIIDLFDRD
jgi:GTPase SAR1 family protein